MVMSEEQRQAVGGTGEVDGRRVVHQGLGAAESDLGKVPGMTEAEIARSKAQMKAGLLMALESSEARANQLARQMLIHGRPIPLEEIVARVDAVTVERARAAGRALISRGRLAIAALGPGNGLDSAASIAQGLVRAA